MFLCETLQSSNRLHHGVTNLKDITKRTNPWTLGYKSLSITKAESHSSEEGKVVAPRTIDPPLIKNKSLLMSWDTGTLRRSYSRNAISDFGNGKGKAHPRTGHEGPEGEQMYSSTLPATSALDGGGWSTPRPGRTTPGKKQVPIG